MKPAGRSADRSTQPGAPGEAGIEIARPWRHRRSASIEDPSGPEDISLDLVMPDMEGVDVLYQLKADARLYP